MLFIRSLIFFLGMAISAIGYSIFAMLLVWLPALTRSRIIGYWAIFIMHWLKWTCGISHEVQGKENIPNTPCVIMSKHQSAWETIAFQSIFPPQAWVLKKELLYIPFFGWGLAASRPIAINRKAGIRALDSVVKQGIDRLQEGRFVVVFPEGTRMPPRTSGKYNPGGAMLATKAEVPILPVAHNAGTFWPKRGFIKYPGVIKVRIGSAIHAVGKKPKDLNKEVESWIEKQMSDLESDAL